MLLTTEMSQWQQVLNVYIVCFEPAAKYIVYVFDYLIYVII